MFVFYGSLKKIIADLVSSSMLLCILSRKSKAGQNVSRGSILSMSNLVQDPPTTKKLCSLHFLNFPKGFFYLGTVNLC